MAKQYIDIIGNKYGKLTVVKYTGINSRRQALFECKCDCGNICIVAGCSLRIGHTNSCGCMQKKKAQEQMKYINSNGLASKGNLKHGDRYTRLYRIWCSMKKRCYYSKYEHYDRYGRRGIRICDEWKNDFLKFKEWALTHGYSENLEIDRINNDGNYEPNNCRWQNRENQVRNRSNTIYLKHNNEEKTLKQWCEIYNINYKLAHTRYKKGWNFEKIFNL